MFDGAMVAIEAEGVQPPAYVQAAVRGCASALGQGRCVEAAPKPAPLLRWRAVIRPSTDPDGRTMVIEVQKVGGATQERKLDFRPEDAVEMRWSTAGVVIAAVVSGEIEAESEAVEPLEPLGQAPEPAVATPSEPFDPIDSLPSREADSPRPDAFELVAFGGTEVYQGPLELGALARAKFGLFGSSFLLVGSGGSAVPANPLIVQAEGFVGVGTQLFAVGDDFSLDLGASFVGQWLWLRHEAASGRVDTADDFRFGAGLDLDARIGISRCWAAVVGGRSTFLWPEVDIRRPPEQIAVVLPAGFGVALGVRYDLHDGC